MEASAIGVFNEDEKQQRSDNADGDGADEETLPTVFEHVEIVDAVIVNTAVEITVGTVVGIIQRFQDNVFKVGLEEIFVLSDFQRRFAVTRPVDEEGQQQQQPDDDIRGYRH